MSIASRATRPLPPYPTLTTIGVEVGDTLLEMFIGNDPAATGDRAKAAVAASYGFESWADLRVEITRRQDGVPGEPDPEHVQMLIDVGTRDNQHSGGSLFEHLLGTRDLLAEWRNPKYVADAGLFHSIYGTESYRIKTVPLARRRDVAAVIGEDAERLAFIFCVAKRTDLLAQVGAPAPCVADLVHGSAIDVTVTELRDLIELEAANAVQQIHPHFTKPSTVTFLVALLESGGSLMSSPARDALRGLIGRCRRYRPADGPRDV